MSQINTYMLYYSIYVTVVTVQRSQGQAGALSTLVEWKVSLSQQEGWNQTIYKVLSNTNHSMILWYTTDHLPGTQPTCSPTNWKHTSTHKYHNPRHKAYLKIHFPEHINIIWLHLSIQQWKFEGKQRKSKFLFPKKGLWSNIVWCR